MSGPYTKPFLRTVPVWLHLEDRLTSTGAAKAHSPGSRLKGQPWVFISKSDQLSSHRGNITDNRAPSSPDYVNGCHEFCRGDSTLILLNLFDLGNHLPHNTLYKTYFCRMSNHNANYNTWQSWDLSPVTSGNLHKGERLLFMNIKE